jgi:hypothetical protein
MYMIGISVSGRIEVMAVSGLYIVSVFTSVPNKQWTAPFSQVIFENIEEELGLGFFFFQKTILQNISTPYSVEFNVCNMMYFFTVAF